MFSVIIPLYNKAPHIAKAIRSILYQSFKEFELIIINDGSTDNSLQIAKSFKDKRLEIIEQSNMGVSVARNNGVKLAKYDYIAFLDADDWWDVNFLKEMLNVINSCPEAAIYSCNFFYVKNRMPRVLDKGFDKLFKYGYINYIETYSKKFVTPVNCSFVVIKKLAFEKEAGFKQNLKFGEDFDLWIRIALKSKIAYLNKPLAYSNQDVSVNQRAIGGQKLWNKENHFIFNLDYLKENEKKNKDLKYLLDGLRLRALMRYYLNNKYSDEVKTIISDIDFNKHPKKFKIIYTYPKSLIRLYFNTKKIGSFMKQKLIKLLR